MVNLLDGLRGEDKQLVSFVFVDVEDEIGIANYAIGLVVAAIIAALNISVALHVVRLATAKLHASHDECEDDPSFLEKIS